MYLDEYSGEVIGIWQVVSTPTFQTSTARLQRTALSPRTPFCRSQLAECNVGAAYPDVTGRREGAAPTFLGSFGMLAVKAEPRRNSLVDLGLGCANPNLDLRLMT